MRIINKWLTKSAVVLLILLSLVSPQAVAQDDFKEDLRWSLNNLPEKIDNSDWRSLDKWYIITHLFETLVGFDLNQNVTSGVAESWSVSDDRLTYRFFIRKNAKFSDGSPIVASDVAYSINRYLQTQNENSLFKKAIDDTKGLEAASDHEIIIRLNFPLENIWSFLAQPQIGGVVSRKSNDKLVTSGPYQLGFISPEKIVLTSNPFYHSYTDEAPKTIGFYKHKSIAESIEWFKQGKTNIYSQLDPFQTTGLDYLKNFKFISYPSHRVGFVYLNVKSPMLSDINLRKSIASALNSNEFSATQNDMMSWDNNFFPKNTTGYIQANKSFDKVKPVAGLSGKTLTFLVEQGLENNVFLDIIKNKLKYTGAAAQFSYLPKSEISARFSKGDFEAGIISLGLPMSDNSFGAYVYFVEQPAYLRDLSSGISQTFLKIIKTTNIIEKKTLLEEISNHIRNDYVVLPLYHTAVRYYLGENIHVRDETNFKIDIQLNNLRTK